MEKIYQGLELLVTLFDIIIFYLSAEVFFTPSKKCRKLEIIWIILLLSIAKTILSWKNVWYLLCTSIPLLVFGLYILYMYLSYTEKIKYKILYVLTYHITMLLSELIIMFPLLLFTNLNLQYFQQPSPLRCNAIILSRLLILLLIMLIKRYLSKRGHYHYEIIKMLLIILSLNYILIFITFILYNYITFLTKNAAFLVIMFSIFLMTILSIIVGMRMFLISEEYYENSLQLQYMKAQEKSNEELEIMSTNLRQLRHDMNNHLGILYGLCDTNQSNEAKTYISKLIGTMESANNLFILPDNKVLSIIISNKKSLSLEKKIKFTFAIHSKKLSLTDMELCSLFGNILDNAIEANMTLSPENRWLDLSVNENTDGWMITCKNPFKEKPIFQNLKFITRKRDSSCHGIGTKTMKTIVEQHNGNIEYHIQENLFLVTIFLPK